MSSSARRRASGAARCGADCRHRPLSLQPRADRASTSITTATRAELFCEQIDREYYLHLAGHKRELEIEPIYERHAELFSRRAVEELREPPGRRAASSGRAAPLSARVRASTASSAGCDRAEASRAGRARGVARGGGRREPVPYRAGRGRAGERARRRSGGLALETARDEAGRGAAQPDPPRGARAHACGLPRARLGELPGGLRGAARHRPRRPRRADRAGSGREPRTPTRPSSTPSWRRAACRRSGELRRSDLPRFFRAPELDGGFDGERLVASFAEDDWPASGSTSARSRTSTSTPSRGRPSPRARSARRCGCRTRSIWWSPRRGARRLRGAASRGRPPEHYAHTDRRAAVRVPPPGRQLGHRVVRLPVRAPRRGPRLARRAARDRASRSRSLATRGPQAGAAAPLRAKLAYERELHADAPDLDAMPARYAELLGGADAGRLAAGAWLADVDPGFYVACYLRAWALETHWRRALRERFGERWFARAGGGRVVAGAVAQRPAAAGRGAARARRSASGSTSARWSPS